MKKNNIITITIFVLFFISSCKKDKIVEPQQESYDFFPLEIGNWWEYSFDYRPSMTSYIWQSGSVKWEIKSIDFLDSNIIYHVGQTVNARVIDGENPFIPTNDTSYISNEFSLFDLIQDSQGFITFTKDNFFNREVMLNIFYGYGYDFLNLTLDSGPIGYPHNVDDNLVALDYEFHKIKLRQNVGIESWTIRNSHNGGPQGVIELINYEIK